ncbi:RHS repeat protein [Streptomyces sp. NBC_00012]
MVTGPTGTSTTTNYGAVNRPLVVTDPLGHTTGCAYDANDSVTKVTDALGETVASVHDKNNRLTVVPWSRNGRCIHRSSRDPRSLLRSRGHPPEEAAQGSAGLHRLTPVRLCPQSRAAVASHTGGGVAPWNHLETTTRSRSGALRSFAGSGPAAWGRSISESPRPDIRPP